MSNAGIINVNAAGIIINPSSGGTGVNNPPANTVAIAEGTSAFHFVGPGTAGQVLQSGGAGVDPAYSSATFPSTAAGTGSILRADGTNWSATTATYPNTTTINQILFSSANNTISGITTANGGVLDTTPAGVPQIDTTNFAVLTTGLQLKGNNTNTTPPAGFIGERFSSFVSGVALSTGVTANIASITLTAGIWDISVLSGCSFSTGGTVYAAGLNTVSATLPVNRSDQYCTSQVTGGSILLSACVPAFRVTIAGNTTYFLVGQATFGGGTAAGEGRISAVRVG